MQYIGLCNWCGSEAVSVFSLFQEHENSQFVNFSQPQTEKQNDIPGEDNELGASRKRRTILGDLSGLPEKRKPSS